MPRRAAFVMLVAVLCGGGIVLAGPADKALGPHPMRAAGAPEAAAPVPAASPEGPSRACSGTLSYENMDDSGYYFPESGGYAIADDIALSYNLRPLTCFRVRVYAQTGPWDLTVSFHPACPPSTGNMLANSSHTFLNLDVGTRVCEWSYPSGAHPNPNGVTPLWMVLNFSRLYRGWVIGDRAQVGFTDDLFAHKDSPTTWVCNRDLGPYQYSGFCAEVWEEEILGACCDDTAYACSDQVSQQDCFALGHRWAPDQTCAELDPPCGGATGACCHPSGACELTLPGLCPDLYLGILTTCDQCPCVIPCPSYFDREAEFCGQGTNNGCGATPHTFSQLYGDPFCGTIMADSATGAFDADWWRLTVHYREQLITFQVSAEFPVLMGFAYIEPDGNGNCDDWSGYLGPYRQTAGQACPPGVSVSKICSPGTYYLVIEPSVTDGYPCTSPYIHYVGDVTSEDVPPPPPCQQTVYVNFPGSITDWDWQIECLDYGGIGMESQLADDFILDAPADLRRVDWGGALGAGDPIQPVGFNIIFYADDGTGNAPVLCLGGDPSIPPSTDNALAIYHVALADITWRDVDMTTYYQAGLDPPFHVDGHTKYWVVVQAHHEPPPSWGPLCHTDPIAFHHAVLGRANLDPPVPFWSDPDLGDDRVDINFCLALGLLCPTELGDVNGDGVGPNNFEITPFVYALTHTEAQFEAHSPSGYYWCADTNQDGRVDNFDITPFVYYLTH
jgi:hypothetical protein